MKNLFLNVMLICMATTSSAQTATLLFKSKTIEAQATFSQTPALSQEAFMKLEFYDAQTKAGVVLADKVSVVLWMPSMGHGSRPTNVIATEISNEYEVSKMYFVMRGDWEVRVILTDIKTGAKETQNFVINL